MNDIVTKVSKRLRGDRKLPNPFMGGNDFLATLKTLATPTDKRNYIKEHNPFLYALGTKLKPPKDYE
jgi:hypothetical protein